jgi:hypothetical protein
VVADSTRAPPVGAMETMVLLPDGGRVTIGRRSATHGTNKRSVRWILRAAFLVHARFRSAHRFGASSRFHNKQTSL